MSFAEFCKSSVLETRRAESQVMVVYDPERRYRDICLETVTDKRAVVEIEFHKEFPGLHGYGWDMSNGVVFTKVCW